MRHWILGCILLGWSAVAWAQPATPVELSFEDYIQYVYQNHPVAKQADLLVAQGDAKLLKARGGFDPKLQGDLARKRFNESLYYNVAQGGLKVPTWFGVEGKVSYEQADGIYLNPERTVPDVGLWTAGISVPIGQGLFIDERRAALRSAQIMLEATEVERLSLLNDLLLDAVKAYWDWFAAYQQLQIIEEALELAEDRFVFTVGTFQQGENPAIDTTESYIQVQSFQLLLNDANVAFTNAGLHLSTFLWLDNGIPLEVTEAAIPAPFTSHTTPLPTIDSIGMWVERLAVQHPDLLQYRYKLDALDVNRRWKVEQLKPDLDLNYNFITSTVGGDEIINGTLDNYKLGVTFQLPVFMRKERGDLQLANLKIQETQLQFDQKTLELTNKVEAYYNDLVNLDTQIDLVDDMVTNYLRLVEAERTLFRLGESSLFLVNSREMKYIDAALKQISLQAKYQKAIYGLDWASGRLAERFLNQP